MTSQDQRYVPLYLLQEVIADARDQLAQGGNAQETHSARTISQSRYDGVSTLSTAFRNNAGRLSVVIITLLRGIVEIMRHNQNRGLGKGGEIMPDRGAPHK